MESHLFSLSRQFTKGVERVQNPNVRGKGLWLEVFQWMAGNPGDQLICRPACPKAFLFLHGHIQSASPKFLSLEEGFLSCTSHVLFIQKAPLSPLAKIHLKQNSFHVAVEVAFED